MALLGIHYSQGHFDVGPLKGGGWGVMYEEEGWVVGRACQGR